MPTKYSYLGAVDLRVGGLELFQLLLLLLLAQLLAGQDVVEQVEEGGARPSLTLLRLVRRRGDLAAEGDGVGVLARPDPLAHQRLVHLKRGEVLLYEHSHSGKFSVFHINAVKDCVK